MRIGVAGTHDIAARCGIVDGMSADSDLFSGRTRSLATGTRIGFARRLSEIVKARTSARWARHDS